MNEFSINRSSLCPGNLPIRGSLPAIYRPEGEFIVDGFNQFDIMQGETGDCWLLSALSAVAKRKSLATRVIKPAVSGSDAAKEGGMYRFQFYNMANIIWANGMISL